MAYNILLNTKFDTNWNFINCKYENGELVSNYKVFGIYQELVLPDICKLYLRCSYFCVDLNIKEVKIGIQNKDVLNIDRKFIKQNKWQSISLIDYTKQEKIKVHIIFESNNDINRIKIKEPLLVNLNKINRSTWLKIILDRTLAFNEGYEYNNIYKELELSTNNEDFKDTNIEKAKIGVIISENTKREIEITAKFNVNKYYLAKLDFEEINKYGDIYFKYGVLKSKRIEEEQIYLLFKGRENLKLDLFIDPKEKLDYKINLKHIMIIDISNMNLQKEDIPYLPFI